ncbi:hypothetical protein M409DRAFT_69112 [Zasmidium cellare ATCC 36951]|uniref:N-acetyltransferase domain-containing protein n=1 Tax=Zasmidium cellare ATCC 36951 TaxID=1080233 RepID=A0A6A6CA68_ZASCE|nr:uncharacterized protein M409DRAFT_69112 [Zasmidium cellare ATCC 36951]KAF2162539.1 hypothetical protein M409DRAFT_69112 [Zasmidium cellare ATCC 36951]
MASITINNNNIIPSLDAERAALDSVAADLGVNDRSAAAAKVINEGHGLTTTPSGNNSVRVLTLSEYKQAGSTLAEAFRKDHTSLYFTHTPDRSDWSEQQKWELHVKMMEYITYAHLLKGLVVCAGPNYDSVALWMPPGQNMDDFLTILRSGMWRLSYQLSREGKKRFFDEFLPLLNDTKAHVLGPRDTTSWYLVYIGTKPSSQGQGHAKAAIEYVTKMADDNGQACYLESSHASNRAMYERRGFELRKEVFLQRELKENVQLDIMVREPVRRDGDSGVEVL